MDVSEVSFADAGGVSIAWQQFGSGPDVLAVPPMLSNIELVWEHEFYRRFFEYIARHVRLTAFDKRGIALSDKFHHHPLSSNAPLTSSPSWTPPGSTNQRRGTSPPESSKPPTMACLPSPSDHGSGGRPVAAGEPLAGDRLPVGTGPVMSDEDPTVDEDEAKAALAAGGQEADEDTAEGEVEGPNSL